MTIKEMRNSLSLTQQKLADEAGVNIRLIQKLESGETDVRNLTLANALAVAGALGITAEELITCQRH